MGRSILCRRVTSAVVIAALSAALMLALPAAAYAKMWYVSATGSDSTGDGTGGNPYATVQTAVNAAASGDVISVGGGKFAGDITMKDGVSLQGAGAAQTILTNTDTWPVITANNIGASTTISGFAITGGIDSDGIYCGVSSPTISNNTISGNGNGINCSHSCPNITNNTISGNAHGIYCGDGGVSSPTITNNIISGHGNGIYALGNYHGSWIIAGNTISGGIYGIYCLSDRAGSWSITNNTISGNTCGIYCTFNDESTWSIAGNTISGNGNGISCGPVQEGGNVLALYSTWNITNNTIIGNSNGVYCAHSSRTIITNIINNTISQCSSAGVSCADPRTAPKIVNCILWSNADDLSQCSATYSVIEHASEALGLGNVTASPDFVNAGMGDFHLSNGSPCIDTATSGSAPTSDKDGNPRPCGSGYDMGAYEYHASSYTANYGAGANGTLRGANAQVVAFNTSGSPVAAVPNPGYHFVSWSDGKTSNPRTETSVTANVSVTANFAANPVLHYVAGAGGSLGGTTSQMVEYGGSGSSVIASPSAGYHFVSWSDGKTANPRTDTNVTADATYTANFAANPVLSTTTSLSGNSSVRVKHAYTLAGVVSRGASGKVTITITRKVSGRWKTMSTPTVTVSSGKFRYTFTPRYSGTWHIVAKYSGSTVGYTTYTSSHSTTKSVTVR